MKLLDYSGLQRFLAKIKTLLDSKANAQHTHSTSDVTDLLSDQHTWSSQQSYNADLNLNYSSTDVDDIIDTLAGSYTAEDFLAQNNVWTGSNTISAPSVPSLFFKNTNLVKGSLPQSNLGIHIDFTDKNNDAVGGYNYIKGPDGTTRLYLELSTTNTNSQQIARSIRFETNQEGNAWTYYPSSNGEVDLGNSGNQWKSVYAQSYYYNGTAWGLDRANTWTGNNSYTEIVSLNSSSDVAEQFIQKLPKDVTVSTDALARFSTLQDSEGHYVVTNTEGHWATYVAKSTTLKYQNDSTKQGTVELRLNSNGKGLLYPVAPFECDLGNAQNQWSNVYAEQYFYNGTQWGLDQANEWSGDNKFKSSSSNFGFQSTTAEIGSLTASSNWMYWLDKNGYQDAYISRDFWNDGSDTLRISISGKRANGAPSTSGTAVECGVRLDIATNGTKSVNPFVSNDTDLGSSALRWKNLYTSDVSTDLVESFPGGTGLLIRSTDQTWENGARMFLYSNTHTGQTYGTIYTDVDHGDENHTKTGLILAPYGLYPMGGGTSGVSLGSSTNRWSSVYADSYYYGTTQWGLDQINVWTNRNVLEAWGFTIRENSITDSTPPASDVGRSLIEVWGKDSRYWGGFGYRWGANGVAELVISNSNWNGNTQGYWEYTVGVNKAFDSLYFKPPDGISDLGTPSNRWKSVHGVTIYENGTALSSKYFPIEKLSNLNVSLNAGLGTIIYGAAYSTSITVQQTYIVQAVNLFYVRYTNLRSSSLGYAPYIKLSDTPMSYGVWEYMGSKDGAQISDTYLLGFWKRIS